MNPFRTLARAARSLLSQIQAVTGSGSQYAAAKKTRFNFGQFGGRGTENAVSTSDLDSLRWQSWKLFRDNPHARKVVRQLTVKVIGTGMHPQPRVMTPGGAADEAARKAIASLWSRAQACLDVRGRAGAGGLDIAQMQAAALKQVILSGEVLARKVYLNESSRVARRAPVGLAIQLIHGKRLLDQTDATYVRGVQFNGFGERLSYLVNSVHPEDSLGEPKQVPARSLIHLYQSEDVDAIRGVPWFAPAIIPMRDVADYTEAEIRSALVAACLSFAYTPGVGQTGLDLPSADGGDLVDGAGNPVTDVQPGMILKLTRGGKVDMLNPARPNAAAEAFVASLVRTEASAFPGIKGSTLTQDYRNSSFSSERAADNDLWPEIELVQQWFANHLMQPIYEAFVTQAVAEGRFAPGVIDPTEFAADPDRFLACEWRGPIARSIKPSEDALAARERVRAGISSPQIEAARVGQDWRRIVEDQADFIAQCDAVGLPEDVIAQMLGLDNPASVGAGKTVPASGDQDEEDG